MSIELTKYTFTKDKFLAATREEQHLFLLSGHLLNELSVLVRLVAWTSKYELDNGPIAAGGLANELTTLLYFMSKLYEGWYLVRARFTPAIQAKYLPKFLPVYRQSYVDLDAYFNGEGRSLIEKVRNNFGFHNHDEFELLLKALNQHPTEEFDIYLHEAPGMCVFNISEQVISFCLGRIVDSNIQDIDQYKDAFNRLLDDTKNMSEKLQNVLLGFQVNFMMEYINGKSKKVKVDITPSVEFNDIEIPYFTKLPDIGIAKK